MGLPPVLGDVEAIFAGAHECPNEVYLTKEQ